jgi:hypothetical protein
MANIAIVCGYGLVGEEYRSQIEMKGLADYFKKINDIVKSRNAFTVIFTGGCTNPDYPDLSESDTAAVYWKSQNFHTDIYSTTAMKIYLEETSKNSQENIFRSVLSILCGEFKTHLGDFSISKDRLLVFCDKPRYWKMKVICWFLLDKNGINYEIRSHNRIDVNIRSNVFFQTLVSTPRMILSPRFWFMCDQVSRSVYNYRRNNCDNR